MLTIPQPFGGLVIPRARLAPVELSFVTSASATTGALQIPATVVAGDLLVYFELKASLSIRNGWAVCAPGTNGISGYRIAQPGDAGSTSLLPADGSRVAIGLMVFRATRPILSVYVGSVNFQDTSGNPSPQTVTASNATNPVVVIAHYAASAAVDPRTFTPAADGEILGGSNRNYAKYKIYNSGPQNVTVDMDDEGVNYLGSFYLEITTEFEGMGVGYIGTVSGRERWAYRSQWIDTAADKAATAQYFIDIILPDNYPADGPYPVLFVGPVEPTPNNFGDGLAMIAGMDVHNDYKCVLVTMTTKSMPWYGRTASGTHAVDRHVIENILPLIKKNYNVIADREGWLFVGFSKSGWGGVSLILRNPSAFGYVGAWDAPWNMSYGQFETATSFGSSGQFALYNPVTILSTYISSVNDKERLWIGAGNNFNSHYTSFTNFLTTNSVPFRSNFANAPTHAWRTDWLSVAIDELFDMRGS